MMKIRPYTGALAGFAGTFLLVLYPISETLDTKLKWSSHDKARIAEWLLYVLSSVVVSALTNYLSWQQAHQRYRRERGESRILDAFRRENNRTLFSGIDQILRRESGVLSSSLNRLRKNSAAYAMRIGKEPGMAF